MLSAPIQMAATIALATVAMRERVLTVQVSEYDYHTGLHYLFAPPIQTDVDECERDLDNCALNAACTDTIGNFTCTCNIGYSGDGVSCGKCSLLVIYYTAIIWIFS